MNVTFYNGLDSSGISFSLEKDGYRIIFDLGSPFEKNTLSTDPNIHSSKEERFLLAKKDDLLPTIPFFYENDEPHPNTIVLISHLHLDHMKWMSYVHPSIPIYMSPNSLSLLKGLIQIQEEENRENYSSLPIEETYTFGPFQITPYGNDHPCYGSVGYLIQTETESLYYTGDHRYHGLHPKEAIESLSRLAKHKIDYLVVDALTEYHKPSYRSFDVPEGKYSATKILSELKESLTNSNSLSVFSIYHRDIDLLNALQDTAKEVGRVTVWEKDTAALLSILHPENEYLIENEDVFLEEIQKNPSHYFLQCSYKESLKLARLHVPNTDYFHLFGEPFVFQKGKMKILLNLLEDLSITYHHYEGLYAFNHAYLENLLGTIDFLNPTYVIPFHTKDRKKLKEYEPKTIFPEVNQTYQWKEGRIDEE